jgi:hypothetical protein
VDYRTLETLRHTHPAWRLLTAEHAPLIASFLHDTFVKPNIRTLSQPQLFTRLDDHLYMLRAELGDGAFPKEPLQYLDGWASTKADGCANTIRQTMTRRISTSRRQPKRPSIGFRV